MLRLTYEPLRVSKADLEFMRTREWAERVIREATWPRPRRLVDTGVLR